MTSNAKTNRRSLKECLKAVLPKRKEDQRSEAWALDGLDTNKFSSLSLLPSIASLSTLPDFEASRFNVANLSNQTLRPPHHDQKLHKLFQSSSQLTLASSITNLSHVSRYTIRHAYQVPIGIPLRPQLCSTQRSTQEVTERSAYAAYRHSVRILASDSSDDVASAIALSEVTSVSSCHGIPVKSPLSQLVQKYDIPAVYRQGVSLQASLATLESCASATSSLRLQRSSQSLTPSSARGRAPHQSFTCIHCAQQPKFGCESMQIHHCQTHDSVKTSSEGPTKTRGWLTRSVDTSRHGSQQSLRDGAAVAWTSATTRSVSKLSEVDAGIASIDHFSSFCVLDAATPGCPITALSKDLQSIFEIGEDFCLDTTCVNDATMDTVTGMDANGNLVVHLVVYSRLINPSSGRNRFVLATLLDITAFITDTTSLPDLETISGASATSAEEIQTPKNLSSIRACHKEVGSSEDIFDRWDANTSIYHETDTSVQVTGKEDIWIDIASEETRLTQSLRSSSSSSSESSSTGCTPSPSMANPPVTDVLDEFLEKVQGLYAEFFLLGKSPLDEDCYEICNISPVLYEIGDYIDGHLSKTSLADKKYLETQLTQDSSFRMMVLWGPKGDAKQLYCIPLFGRSNVTWVCFLVDAEMWRGLSLW